MSETRNSVLLKSFADYCHAHPDERFFQALRNWCGWRFVFVAREKPVITPQGDVMWRGNETVDTFHWEGVKSSVVPRIKLDERAE